MDPGPDFAGVALLQSALQDPSSHCTLHQKMFAVTRPAVHPAAPFATGVVPSWHYL